MMKKSFVFGSAVCDLVARGPRLPAPGETVLGSQFFTVPGGKGFNQAVAAHLAGGHVTMASKLGKDAFGQITLDHMAMIGMDTSRILVTDEHPTATALIMVDEATGQNAILITPAALESVSTQEVDALADEIRASDLLLTQLEMNLDATRYAMGLAKDAGVRVIFNPAPARPLPDDFYATVDIITPNEVEAEQLTGIRIETEADAGAAAAFFRSKGVEIVVITLGARGAFVATESVQKIVSGFPVEAIDTTGAGDAFNGALLTALAEGQTIWEATVFANAAAAFSVQKLGASVAMPRREEIDRFLGGRK